mgnify:CR=1 FL=1
MEVLVNILASVAILFVGVFVGIMNTLIWFCEDVNKQLRCLRAYKIMSSEPCNDLESYMKKYHGLIYTRSSVEIKISKYTRSLIKADIRRKFKRNIKSNDLSNIIYHADTHLGYEMTMKDKGYTFEV